MQSIQCEGGSINSSEITSQDRDTNSTGWGENNNPSIIQLASTIPLPKIFALYKLNCNEHNRQIICPFKKHKGGNENSGSFWYFPESNSFYCFGCNRGGKYAHGVHWVAWMEGIALKKAAEKLLNYFGHQDYDASTDIKHQDFHLRFQVMLQFSTMIREFLQEHSFHPQAVIFAEAACQKFDRICLRFKDSLDTEGLKRVVEQCQEYLTYFKL